MALKKWTCLLLAAALSLALAACQAQPSKRGGGTGEDGGITAGLTLQTLRGVVVRSSGQEAGYPKEGKMSQEELEQAADEIVRFARENSMNAILYEAAPQGEAMWVSDVLPLSGRFHFPAGLWMKHDPLETLIRSAQKEGVAVYAMLSPYGAGSADSKPGRKTIARKSPESTVVIGDERWYRPDNAAVHIQAVSAATELAKKYNLSGIVIDDADGCQVSDYPGFYTYLTALASDIAGAVRAASKGGMQVGITLTDRAQQSGNRSAFIDEACRSGIDFIAPAIYESAMGGGMQSAYAQSLQPYVDTASAYGTPVYAALPITQDISSKTCEDALLIQNQMGLTGGVLRSYSQLSGTRGSELMDAIIPMLHLKGRVMPDYTLDIPQQFRVTRPLDGKKLTIDAGWKTYYITGTSDPALPVLFEGEEIRRDSQSGLFGVLVDVEPGENTYEFSQGDETVTVTLYRPDGTGVTRISKISTYTSKGSTVFQPYGPQAVANGLPMLFQCTAPSGGKVTATLDGKDYELTQAKAAEDGVPAVFRKEVAIPAKDPDAVESIGKVTYTLDYNGETSEVEAPGEVYLVGGNRTPMFRVTAGMGTVMNPSMQDGDFMTTLKTGSVGVITGQTANYFKTSFGGMIQKVETSIVTDLDTAENHVQSAEYIRGEDGEEMLVLHGTVNASFVVDSAEDGDLSVRLFDTYGLPDGVIEADSAFFSSILVDNNGEGTASLAFKAGAEPYFGYNIQYDGDNTIVLFKKRPSVSGMKGQPLKGLTIVVDPGHGADDPGSMGVPGTTGPAEKNVNLYASLMIRRLLEGLGADVQMTRETDEDFLELDERVSFTERHNADLFISVHHNSAVETIDPARVEGTWVYYYNDISADIAQAYLEGITSVSGRKAMGTEQAWYVVCRNTIAPSVLLELGFMPNPKEYEDICDEEKMLDIARSVCDAVVGYLS